MGREQVDRMLLALEGRFAGALAAEDEASARDLAFSLSQDVPVAADVLRDGACVVVGDMRLPVDHVGHDFLEAGAWMVPLERAVVAFGHDRRPARRAQVFLGALRMAARESAEVVLGLRSGGLQSGILVRAGTAHVVVDGRGPVAVPLGEIAYVRRVRGGSAGAP